MTRMIILRTMHDLEAWIEQPSAPCSVTDWHVDEPWEDQPARFTVLYAAISEGEIRTRFASTAAYWRDGIREEDKTICRTAIGTFAPPPWLPQEAETACHPLTRHTLAGEAMCAWSSVGVGWWGAQSAGYDLTHLRVGTSAPTPSPE